MQKSILMSTCLQNNILSVTVGTALHLVRLFSSLQLYKQKSQNLVSPKFMRLFFILFFLSTLARLRGSVGVDRGELRAINKLRLLYTVSACTHD